MIDPHDVTRSTMELFKRRAKRLEKELAELKEAVEIAPKVSKYRSGVCSYRMLVDGQYFGYVDGEWKKSSDQALSKSYYELGLEEK